MGELEPRVGGWRRERDDVAKRLVSVLRIDVDAPLRIRILVEGNEPNVRGEVLVVISGLRCRSGAFFPNQKSVA